MQPVFCFSSNKNFLLGLPSYGRGTRPLSICTRKVVSGISFGASTDRSLRIHGPVGAPVSKDCSYRAAHSVFNNVNKFLYTVF